MWTGENAVVYLKEHLTVEWTTDEYNRVAKKHKITLGGRQLDNHRRFSFDSGEKPSSIHLDSSSKQNEGINRFNNRFE